MIAAIGGFLAKTVGLHLLKGGAAEITTAEKVLTGLGFRGGVGLALGLFIGHAGFRKCVLDLLHSLL